MAQDERKLIFFHSPNTRSSGVAVLLEELQAPHETRVLNMKAGEQREAAFLAVNPMGKVPAILHGDALVTEQPAIFLYLADLFPGAGLTPAIGDALRGPFLRWLVYYGSCFEPAMVDRAMQREPGRPGMSPYGSFEAMFNTLNEQLRKGPYILGQRLTAADILWGGALNWMTKFKLIPETPEINRYVERVTTRPAFESVTQRDAALSAEHEKAAAPS